MEKLQSAQFSQRPAIARTIVRLSTLPARARLFNKPQLRILVDNTVLSHSITHETAWISTGTARWGPHEVRAGYSARISVSTEDSQSREHRSIRYLPGIAHLARIGAIQLMTSGELWLERFNQPAGRFSGYGYFDLNLFEGVEMPMVDKLPDMALGPTWMGVPKIREMQRERLAKCTDPLFRGLVAQLGPNNSQDAWHIRTAEANGMLCFLTMDFSLLKNLDARRNSEPVRSLQTKVMTPEDLGRQLALVPINPVLLSFQGANSPIRGDLHWPDSKRQKRKTPNPRNE